MPQTRLTSPEAVRSGGFTGGIQVTPEQAPQDTRLNQLASALGRMSSATSNAAVVKQEEENFDLEQLAQGAAAEAQRMGIAGPDFLEQTADDPRLEPLRRNPGRFMARMDIWSGEQRAQRDFERMSAEIDVTDIEAVQAWRAENVEGSDSPFYSRGYNERLGALDGQLNARRSAQIQEETAQASTAILGATLSDRAAEIGWGAAMDELSTGDDGWSAQEVSRSAMRHAAEMAAEGNLEAFEEIVSHERTNGLSLGTDTNYNVEVERLRQMGQAVIESNLTETRSAIEGTIQERISQNAFQTMAELRDEPGWDDLLPRQRAALTYTLEGRLQAGVSAARSQADNALEFEAINAALHSGSISGGVVYRDSSGELQTVSPEDAAIALQERIMSGVEQTPEGMAQAFATMSRMSTDNQIVFPALQNRLQRALEIPLERLDADDLTAAQQQSVELFMRMDENTLASYFPDIGDRSVVSTARDLNRWGSYSPTEALALSLQVRGVTPDEREANRWARRVSDRTDDANFTFVWQDRSTNFDSDTPAALEWADEMGRYAARIEAVAGRRAANGFLRSVARDTMIINRQPIAPIGEIRGPEGEEFLRDMANEIAESNPALARRLNVENTPDGVHMEDSRGPTPAAVDFLGLDFMRDNTGIRVFDEDGPIFFSTDELNAAYGLWAQDQLLAGQASETDALNASLRPTWQSRIGNILREAGYGIDDAVTGEADFGNLGEFGMGPGGPLRPLGSNDLMDIQEVPTDLIDSPEPPQASPEPSTPPSVPVTPQAAITSASRALGVDQDYLSRVAQRESAMNPTARAPTSSATGLFQFVEQTWLQMVRTHGARYGLEQEAASITVNERGRLSGSEEILELRNDPRLASLMAAHLTSENGRILRGRIGREPTHGELYAAHFMGAGSASRLIRLAAETPEAIAAELFPREAASNQRIFYRNGQPRTVQEVLNNLTRI